MQKTCETLFVELVKENRRPFPYRKFPEFEAKNRNTFTATLSKRRAEEIRMQASRYHLKYYAYDSMYKRSSGYRAAYLRKHPSVNGKYRCVYCGKLLPKEMITIDHVIPVDAARHSKKFRKLLPHGVNDDSNLVPSCLECNRKKGQSTAKKWWRKAKHGSRESYWTIRLIMHVIFLFVLAGLTMLFLLNGPEESIQQCIEYLHPIIVWLQDLLRRIAKLITKQLVV